MDYTGALYVKGSEGSDYVGVVFGYQSNRKSYVVMWRRENSNFQDLNDRAGIKGVQLKVRPLLGNDVARVTIYFSVFIDPFTSIKSAQFENWKNTPNCNFSQYCSIAFI